MLLNISGLHRVSIEVMAGYIIIVFAAFDLFVLTLIQLAYALWLSQKRQETKHEIWKDSAPLNICELTPKLITALLLEDKMTKAG